MSWGVDVVVLDAGINVLGRRRSRLGRLGRRRSRLGRRYSFVLCNTTMKGCVERGVITHVKRHEAG